MDGHGDIGDDFSWDGLVCPPLEDYAFNFDATADDMFDDDALLDIDVVGNYDSDQITGRKVTRKKPTSRTYGRGKELKTLRQVLGVEKHSKTSFDSQDYSRLYCTNHVFAVDNKRKADYDLRSEERVTTEFVRGSEAKVDDNRDHCPRSYENHGKGKELSTASDQAMNMNEERTKGFRGETENFVENRDKKRRIMDCNSQRPMQCKDMTRLDNKKQLAVGNNRKDDHNGRPMQRKKMTEMDRTNQFAGVDNKRIADYDLRFEATRQKLHVQYKQDGDAKQQKRIQVIDFQKSSMEQPRSKAKAKERPSLRQKLKAMGTCKSNKKFPTYKTLSSCIHE